MLQNTPPSNTPPTPEPPKYTKSNFPPLGLDTNLGFSRGPQANSSPPSDHSPHLVADQKPINPLKAAEKPPPLNPPKYKQNQISQL